MMTNPPLLRALAALSLFLGSLGCGDGDERSLAISRDQFIDAYVDLRVEALRGEDEALTDSARAPILARHGVTEEQLLRFAEVRGGDLMFMRDVWNEIEAKLDSVPVLLDGVEP